MRHIILSKNIIINFNNSNIVNRFFTTSSKINSPPYKILFFGTDNVSLPILKSLHENQKLNNLVEELQVICPKSEKKELVESYAIENGINITYPENGSMKGFKLPTTSNNEPFDLAVVVSFGHFIPKSILTKFKYGGINMHPSLLPRHRGAAPIYHTILSDDNEAGISIIELHHDRFDCGKILKQENLQNYNNITKDDYLYSDLLSELSELGSKTVIKTLEEFPQLSMNSIEQSENGKTQAPKVNRIMSKLVFSNQTKNEIWLLYKAFSDNIGLNCLIFNKKSKSNKTIKIKEMLKPTDDHTNEIYKSLLIDINIYEIENNSGEQLPFGTYFIEFDKSKLYHNIMWVKCKDGWVGFTKVFEEGKKNTVKSSEFLFGKNVVSINNSNKNIENNKIPSTQILF